MPVGTHFRWRRRRRRRRSRSGWRHGRCRPRPVNQHGLARADPGTVDQAFPGGDEYQWRCCCFARVERFWSVRQQLRIDDRVLRQRALHAADTARHAEHCIAPREILHALADSHDVAGHVDTENRR